MSVVAVNQEVEEFQSRLSKVSLDPIIFKLMDPEEGKGWTYEYSKKVLSQYKIFLLLNKLYPGRSIVPTKDIDIFWHYHILDTELYYQHCMFLFGRILHHFPYFGMRGDDDRQALTHAFEDTKQLFQEYGYLLIEEGMTCGASCKETLCAPVACEGENCTPAPGPQEMAIVPDDEVLLKRIGELMEVRPELAF